MTRNGQVALFLGGGFLSLILGALPLNGYLGCLLAPREFHFEAFIGSNLHLLAGLIPWLAGVVLIAFGADRPLQVFAVYLAALAGCFLISTPSMIHSCDRSALVYCVRWAAIATLGVVCALVIRWLANRCKKG